MKHIPVIPAYILSPNATPPLIVVRVYDLTSPTDPESVPRPTDPELNPLVSAVVGVDRNVWEYDEGRVVNFPLIVKVTHTVVADLDVVGSRPSPWSANAITPIIMANKPTKTFITFMFVVKGLDSRVSVVIFFWSRSEIRLLGEKTDRTVLKIFLNMCNGNGKNRIYSWHEVHVASSIWPVWRSSSRCIFCFCNFTPFISKKNLILPTL